MKFFISYCERDGEGLGYAMQAKETCRQKDIESWVWGVDSSSAEWLKTDIVNNIDSCQAMLTIVTAGTENSEPQKEEWSFASSFGKINVSLRKKGLSIPIELRSRRSPEFDDNDFEEMCNRVIEDIVTSLTSDRPTLHEKPAKTYKLFNIARQLEKSQEELNKETVKEFNKSVWEGYLGSNIIRNVVSLADASEEDEDNLVNIVILSNIDLNRFNAKDHWWEPAFRQLGREIAIGESRFLVKRVEEEVDKISESCNMMSNELSAILKEIERLNSQGCVPDVILAPPSMLTSFTKFFQDEKGRIDFTGELKSNATLEVKGINKLGIYLLGGGILSDSVIMFSRSSVIWKVVPNPDTGYALTATVGRGRYPDKVTFIMGTTVRCVIAEREGITRIPIER